MRIRSNYSGYTTVKSGAIWGIALIILLFLPDDAFLLTAIYRSETLPSIAYKWLDYSFSVLLIPFILKALSRINRSDYFFFVCMLFTFIRSVAFWMCGEDNIFSMHSYEVVFTLVSGWSVYKVFRMWRKRYHRYSDNILFEWFCLLHFASQIFGALFLKSGVGNRYNAIGIDVEMTSFLYASYIIYAWNDKRLKTRVIKLCMFVGLLLTGARTALILLVVILTVNVLIALFIRIKKSHVKGDDIVFWVACLLLGTLVIAVLPHSLLYKAFSALARMQDFFADRGGTSLGRIKSLQAGFEILKDHYWGLDCSFVILQKYVNMYNYPTFPHSYILCFRIIYGPVLFWAGTIHFIKVLLKSAKNRCVNYALLVFLFLFLLVTGGVMVNYKVVFLVLLIFNLATADSSLQTMLV